MQSGDKRKQSRKVISDEPSNPVISFCVDFLSGSTFPELKRIPGDSSSRMRGGSNCGNRHELGGKCRRIRSVFRRDFPSTPRSTGNCCLNGPPSAPSPHILSQAYFTMKPQNNNEKAVQTSI